MVLTAARPPVPSSSRLRTRSLTGADETLAALLTSVAARQQCDARRAPTLAAELDRRLDRAAAALRPPPVVARAAATADRPASDPLVRAWQARVLCLPPATVLLVLARARWFLPAAAPVRRRRAALARALLDGLDRPERSVEAPLRAVLLTSPVIDADSAPLLARGLAAYAARDELTALHLLVPRLESVLRGLARRLPAGGGRPAAGLVGLLRHAPLRRVLGDALADQLQAVLVTDGGLRHRLAHGRLAPAACTRRVAQDVVLCYLRLSRLALPAAPPTGGSAPPRGATHA